MAAGCVTVPTYTTNTERDHTHIFENSGAAAVIVSNAKLARTVLPAVIRSSHARIVIGMEDLRAAQSGAYTAYSRSEEHTSELQSLMRISYAVFCLKKKKIKQSKSSR